MSAAKKTQGPDVNHLRYKLDELGHVLAISAALAECMLAIGAFGGDTKHALSKLRLLAVEVNSAVTESRDIHKATFALLEADEK